LQRPGPRVVRSARLGRSREEINHWRDHGRSAFPVPRLHGLAHAAKAERGGLAVKPSALLIKRDHLAKRAGSACAALKSGDRRFFDRCSKFSRSSKRHLSPLSFFLIAQERGGRRRAWEAQLLKSDVEAKKGGVSVNIAVLILLGPVAAAGRLRRCHPRGAGGTQAPHWREGPVTLRGRASQLRLR
jgi:hypothetical protein